jgi:hypothetical protein
VNKKSSFGKLRCSEEKIISSTDKEKEFRSLKEISFKSCAMNEIDLRICSFKGDE